MGMHLKFFVTAVLQCTAFVPVPIESLQQSIIHSRGKITKFSNSGGVSKSISFGRASTSIYSENNENGTSGGLMSMGDSLKSQLQNAFSALDESDQYDAVLTGLCAKILDQPKDDTDQIIVALQDPFQLLDEMNSRRIKAGSRSLMALIDVRFLVLVFFDFVFLIF